MTDDATRFSIGELLALANARVDKLAATAAESPEAAAEIASTVRELRRDFVGPTLRQLRRELRRAIGPIKTIRYRRPRQPRSVTPRTRGSRRGTRLTRAGPDDDSGPLPPSPSRGLEQLGSAR